MPRVLPEQGGAHPEPDAERGEPVADVGSRRKPKASWLISRTPVAASGCPQAIAPPYGLRRGSSGATASPSHQVSTCTANGSLSSNRPMSSIVRPARSSTAPCRRDRPEPHQVRLDTGVREPDESHRRLETQLGGGVLGREQRGRRAVGETGGVAGGDPAAGAERRAERRETLEGRVGAEELVAVGDRPALVAEDGHRHDGVREDPVGLRPGGRRPLLRTERVTRRRPRASAAGTRRGGSRPSAPSRRRSRRSAAR